MNPRYPYDPFGAELKKFAETLDRRQFRSLSPGFGYAKVDKSALPSPIAPIPKHLPNYETIPTRGWKMERSDSFVVQQKPIDLRPREASPPVKTFDSVSSNVSKSYVRPFAQRSFFQVNTAVMHLPASILREIGKSLAGIRDVSLSVSHFISGMTRLLLIHLVDLFAVGFSIGVALIASALIFAPQNQNALTLTQKILAWSPVQLLMDLPLATILATVYVVYGLYFIFLKLVTGSTLGHTLFGKSRLPS